MTENRNTSTRQNKILVHALQAFSKPTPVPDQFTNTYAGFGVLKWVFKRLSNLKHSIRVRFRVRVRVRVRFRVRFRVGVRVRFRVGVRIRVTRIYGPGIHWLYFQF